MEVIYGLGNPLVDILIELSDSFFLETGVIPGTMNLVDKEYQENILLNKVVLQSLAGGGCANTMRGISWLNLNVSPCTTVYFSGAIGNDSLGELFTNTLKNENVLCDLQETNKPTGSSIIGVSGNGERTMFTHLGACHRYSIKEREIELLPPISYFHALGFMFDTTNQHHALNEMVKRVQFQKGKISFDIADILVVKRHEDILVPWIRKNVDILFANRNEFYAVSKLNQTIPIEELGEFAFSLSPLVIIKDGAKGCYIFSKTLPNGFQHIPAIDIHPVDTTAAGDAFAAGFLYGLAGNVGVGESGVIANTLAGAMCTVQGCSYNELSANYIRMLKGIL